MKQSARNLTHLLQRWIHPGFALLAILASVLTLGGTMALAQSGAGSIQGTVTDTTGAVIPSAKVTVTNQATNVKSTTTSNRVGFYQIPGLFTGAYTVSVTVPNMKTYNQVIDLLVGQAAVINPVMTAGSVTQQVNVSANTVELTDTDDGAISSTVENARINQIPMNGRLLLTLLGELTPGVVNAGGEPRVNGLEAEATEYLADGIPMINRDFGGAGGTAQAQLPDPDSVQEVTVNTDNPSAQFATPSAIVITTKSGTNALHGTFFETARNNGLGIAKARQDPPNFSAPHYVRNEFGLSAGGPIVLPAIYHGKNKSFWFLAYERYSLAQISYQLNRVATDAMRHGDWSGLVNSAGIQQTLYDATTTAPSNNCNGSGTSNTFCRAPYPTIGGLPNQIPLSRMSPTSKILFDITPRATSNANPLVEPNLTAPNPQFTVVPTITFRLDHSFDQNNRAYLRFQSNTQYSSQLRDNPLNEATIAADGIPAGASGFQNSPVTTFGAGIGFTHVFSPTFYSETILSQEWQGAFYKGGGDPNLNYEQKFGLPNNFGETGFPDIDPSGFGNLFGTQWQYGENQIISNIDENLTKIEGRHQLMFGGRYRHERFGYIPDQSHDVVHFGGEATALENPASGANYYGTPNTGYVEADYFLGDANYYQIHLNAPYLHFHDMEFDSYFQDNYHASRNLTVNIGLRYEAHPAAWVKYGLNTGFDLKNDALVLDKPASYYVAQGYSTNAIFTNLANIGAKIETPAEAGLPSTIMKNYDFILSPRVGLAYQLFGGKHGTVLRGAYGRYIYPIPTRSAIINSAENPPFEATYTQSYTAANQAPDSLPNYLIRANWDLASNPHAVQMGVNSTNAVDSSSTNAILPGSNLINQDPHYAPDIVTETNVTLEQALKGNSALRVSWVWTHGSNLDHFYYYNNHPSAYVWEMETGTIPPNGSVIGSNTYAATATGPYDQTTWGSNALDEKNGWSNDSALQATYQRLFHRGVGYQITYVWSKPMRFGGNWLRDGKVYPTANYVGNTGTIGAMSSPYGTVINPYLPPARPAGIAPYAEYRALDKYAGYVLDTAIPKQQITFNGIVDLPFGRGKRFMGDANRFLNELVGGFQLAGVGQVISQDFGINSGNWGPTNPLQVYKHKVPITDCRSGVCYKSYEWFSGYLAPTVTSACTNGKCVTGLPGNWAPYQSPIDTTVGSKYYNENEVNITLANGQVVPQGYSPGPVGTNPYSRTFLNGPINYSADLSLFKVFPITERVNVRFNMDAFNAFNIQGYNNPNTSDGTEAVEPGVGVASSHNTPRQIQLTLRLTF